MGSIILALAYGIASFQAFIYKLYEVIMIVLYVVQHFRIVSLTNVSAQPNVG